ncbi:MAG: hypothetical protein V1844_13925 [Pseudomonadota bacterium]
MKKQIENEQVKAEASLQMASGNSSGWASSEQRKTKGRTQTEDGKVGWILLWALGVPIPILLVLFVLRGCT